MTDALTQAWADIRKRSKNTVPRAVIAVTPGKSGSTCGSVTWTDDPVLLADTVTLGKAPLEILGRLLHLAAHGKADTGRKPSQSSEGRYHDAAYKTAAQALGLKVTTGPGPAGRAPRYPRNWPAGTSRRSSGCGPPCRRGSRRSRPRGRSRASGHPTRP